MKDNFYARLALTGMRKNKRLYMPYFLTCAGMVLMFYIIDALSMSPLLDGMFGGGNLRIILMLGRGVIGFFALIFLFYTNSFLMRRRKKEFGLYHILGMDKRNIGRILLWETGLLYAACLLVGLAGGIALSKLAELGLFYMLQEAPSFTFFLPPLALLQTAIVFAFIFLLILYNALRQVKAANPLELLRSESSGEKPPKANYLLAVLGFVLLSIAYGMAVMIESPLAAFGGFSLASILVILASYLLFIAGSVAFCKILQKKKGYYYQAKHFVSLSSMTFRMKRNGAGLASICILSTMVLVILSSTISLYLGTEESLRARYPRDFSLEWRVNLPEHMSEERFSSLRAIPEALLQKEALSPQNTDHCRYATMGGFLSGEQYTPAHDFMRTDSGREEERCMLMFLPLSDYQRMSTVQETLAPGEALAFAEGGAVLPQSLRFSQGTTFSLRPGTGDFSLQSASDANLLPVLLLVLPDFEKDLLPLLSYQKEDSSPLLATYGRYHFDLDADKETQMQLATTLREGLAQNSMEQQQTLQYYSLEGLAAHRADFYTTYGGLLFLGLILSLAFLLAAVLIIYYKQLSEGYEDQARFAIMRKLGMTKQDIRRSVNAQVLTVFFLPLGFAGLHFAFAFPMIFKLLQLLELQNMQLLLLLALASFLLFALFYALVYRLTSNAYFAIVSGKKDHGE